MDRSIIIVYFGYFGIAVISVISYQLSVLQSFGAEVIHNTGNLIRLEHGSGSIHQKITNFYNSIQPDLTGSDNITVREWIGSKSFEEQQDFGIRVVITFGVGYNVDFRRTNNFKLNSYPSGSETEEAENLEE